jgi:L-threonylcarbamoyladenylate synthase
MARLAPDAAATLLRDGGVLAYPTEAVWGLGCDPFDEAAVLRLLAIKQRPVDKGVILVGASIDQFDGLLDWDRLPRDRTDAVRASWPGPRTWIVPTTARMPRWITGMHDGVAVRVSDHPIVIAICRAFGGPIVSTSANLAGEPPAFAFADLAPAVLSHVDGVSEGETGGLGAPTAIRDAATGAELRGGCAARRSAESPRKPVRVPRSAPCRDSGTKRKMRACAPSPSCSSSSPASQPPARCTPRPRRT